MRTLPSLRIKPLSSLSVWLFTARRYAERGYATVRTSCSGREAAWCRCKIR